MFQDNTDSPPRDYDSHASCYGRSKEFYQVLHKTGMKLTDREKGMIARFYVEAQKQGFPRVNSLDSDRTK